MVDFMQLIGILKKRAREAAAFNTAAPQCAPSCQGGSQCQQVQAVKEELKDGSNVLQSSHAQYEVVCELGKGVYGKVMKCREVRSKQFVAVKVLNSNPRFSEAGKKEVEFLTQLREAHCCDHIVQCLEWFTHCEHTCIVFEMLGQTLEQLAEQNRPAPLPLTHARFVLWQLLSALQQLKTLGIVHADVKPDNIMVTNDCSAGALPRVKLIDFSCAVTAAECTRRGCGLLGSSARRRCPYAQTRHFRAPEVLLGAGLSTAADMWSLGCVAGGLLLGHTLFPGASEYDQLRYICAAQGLPSRVVAQNARRAGVFFRLDVVDGMPKLVLKSDGEVEQETGRRQALNDAQRPLRSLDELGPRYVRALARGRTLSVPNDNVHVPTPSDPVPHAAPADLAPVPHDPAQNAGPVQLTPAAEALHLCVGLVKAMLDLDQAHRIRPVEALAHPFFVLPAPRADQPPEDYGDFSREARIGRTSSNPSSSPVNVSFNSIPSPFPSSSPTSQSESDLSQRDYIISETPSSTVRSEMSPGETPADYVPPSNHFLHNPLSTGPLSRGNSLPSKGSDKASPVLPAKLVSCATAAATKEYPALSRWAQRGRALGNLLRAGHDSCVQ